MNLVRASKHKLAYGTARTIKIADNHQFSAVQYKNLGRVLSAQSFKAVGTCFPCPVRKAWISFDGK